MMMIGSGVPMMSRSRLFLAAALLVLAAACQKEPAFNNDDNARVLRASLEGVMTRTTIGQDYSTEWVRGDAVGVFGATGVNAMYTVTSVEDRVAVLECAGDVAKEEEGPYVALYPYQQGSSCENGVITADIPSQQYLEGTATVASGALVAVARQTSDFELPFKNVCGLIEVQIDRADITEIKVEGARDDDGRSIPMAGRVRIDVADFPTAAVVNAVSSVYLHPAAAAFVKNKKYYIAVLPGEFPNGITFTYKLQNGSTYTRSIKESMTIGRNGGFKVQTNPVSVIKTAEQLLSFLSFANRCSVGYSVALANDIDMSEAFDSVQSEIEDVLRSHASNKSVRIQDDVWIHNGLGISPDVMSQVLEEIGTDLGVEVDVDPSSLGKVIDAKRAVFGALFNATYRGTFDGAGHTITNWGFAVPLFAVNEGTVKNLTLEGDGTPLSVPTGAFGFIASVNKGLISSCTTDVDVLVEDTLADTYIFGAVAGSNEGSNSHISSCDNKGNLTFNLHALKGPQFIGGVLGRISTAHPSSYVNVDGCSNSGDIALKIFVSGRNPSVGGVVGGTPQAFGSRTTAYQAGEYGIVAGCSNSGDLTFAQDYYAAGGATLWNAGGVVGYMEGEVNKCENSGRVSFDCPYDGVGRPVFGGVAGFVSRAVIGCKNLADGHLYAKGEFVRSNDIFSAGTGGVMEPAFGGVVGVCGVVTSGTLSDCVNEGKVTADVEMYPTKAIPIYFGGVAGICHAVAAYCVNNGTVDTVSGFYQTYVGGVFGDVYTNISKCENNGFVRNRGVLSPSVNESWLSYLGGIVARHQGGTISECTNGADAEVVYTGNSTSLSWSYVGGILGLYGANITMSKCCNEGLVHSDAVAPAKVGGLAGEITGTISGSSNTGTVSIRNTVATSNSPFIPVGGLVGYAYNVQFKSCEAEGEVVSNVASASYAGSAVGAFKGNSVTKMTFSNLTLAGNVTGVTGTKVGLIAGMIYDCAASSFAIKSAYIRVPDAKLNGTSVRSIAASSLFGDVGRATSVDISAVEFE